MQLGAIQPINVAQIQSGSAPAAPVKYVPTPDKSGNEPSQAPSASPLSPENLKKYAPYIIGAIVLYFLLNRKK